MNLYIDYSEFELTCWNTDGKGTNVAIPLTEEQAKKICDIIGLLGFAEENGKIVGKDQGKISPWFFYFVCKILSKSVM